MGNLTTRAQQEATNVIRLQVSAQPLDASRIPAALLKWGIGYCAINVNVSLCLFYLKGDPGHPGLPGDPGFPGPPVSSSNPENLPMESTFIGAH